MEREIKFRGHTKVVANGFINCLMQNKINTNLIKESETKNDIKK